MFFQFHLCFRTEAKFTKNIYYNVDFLFLLDVKFILVINKYKSYLCKNFKAPKVGDT